MQKDGCLKKENKKDGLSLYIHIPFCVQKCRYCDFLSMPADEETRERYVQDLLLEIASYQNTALAGRPIKTVFIGGGTPSILKNVQIERILTKIKSTFNFCDSNCECTMELNPGTVTGEDCRVYRELGINRVSVGLQSVCDEELRTLGRIHDFRTFLDTFQNLRNAGFTNINIDLMSALPGQTLSSYEKGLKTVLELAPEHISAYSLIIEEGTPFYELYGENNVGNVAIPPLANEDEERQMYELTGSLLREYGYRRYEISNYAKEGYECRHNLVYWQGGEYLGLGLGSASLLANTRYKNESDLKKYMESLENEGKQSFSEKVVLSEKDRMAEFMYLGLRCMEGISMSRFEQQFGVPIYKVYGAQLEQFFSLGLLQTVTQPVSREERISLTERGIDVSNRIFSEFLL